MRDWLGAWDSWSWLNAILSACCTCCMRYLVYAVLSINLWLWNGEIKRYHWISCSQVMVKWMTRKREMWGEGRNHYKKLELKRHWSVCQISIPNTAVTTSDPAAHDTASRYSQPNQISHPHNFQHSLESSTYCSHLHPPSLFLVHNFIIITEYKVKLYLSISPYHDYKLTPSTASTKYSIHPVQHPPSRASTRYSIRQILTVITSFSRLRVDLWMMYQLLVYISTRSTASS